MSEINCITSLCAHFSLTKRNEALKKKYTKHINAFKSKTLLNTNNKTTLLKLKQLIGHINTFLECMTFFFYLNNII